MRLGDLIDTLQAETDQKQPVLIEFPNGMYGGIVPAGEFVSYRGYYDQLALTPGKGRQNVADLLKLARQANGGTFYGWKGGEYTMGRNTAVWAADSGDATGIGISGIAHTSGQLVLLTVDVNDYQGW